MTARVLCCTARPHPDAMTALAAYAPQAEVIDVAGDEFGYWREIRQRWVGERDLIVIEQDIEIGPGTIASLECCPEPWCVFAYPVCGGRIRLTLGLGCIKISAGLQRLATAKRIAQGLALCPACRGKGCWRHLDQQIIQVIRGQGLEPHVHGDVIHHHDYGFTRQQYVLADWALSLGAQVPQALFTDESWPLPAGKASHGR